MCQHQPFYFCDIMYFHRPENVSVFLYRMQNSAFMTQRCLSVLHQLVVDRRKNRFKGRAAAFVVDNIVKLRIEVSDLVRVILARIEFLP